MIKQDSKSMPFGSSLEDLKVNGASKSTLQYYESHLKSANDDGKLYLCLYRKY